MMISLKSLSNVSNEVIMSTECDYFLIPIVTCTYTICAFIETLLLAAIIPEISAASLMAFVRLVLLYYDCL